MDNKIFIVKDRCLTSLSTETSVWYKAYKNSGDFIVDGILNKNQKLKKNNFVGDDMIEQVYQIPVIFLYRHSIELQLKDIYLFDSNLLDSDGNIKGENRSDLLDKEKKTIQSLQHSFITIWEEIKKNINKIITDKKDNEIIFIENFINKIKELVSIDLEEVKIEELRKKGVEHYRKDIEFLETVIEKIDNLIKELDEYDSDSFNYRYPFKKEFEYRLFKDKLIELEKISQNKNEFSEKRTRLINSIESRNSKETIVTNLDELFELIDESQLDNENLYKFITIKSEIGYFKEQIPYWIDNIPRDRIITTSTQEIKRERLLDKKTFDTRILKEKFSELENLLEYVGMVIRSEKVL